MALLAVALLGGIVVTSARGFASIPAEGQFPLSLGAPPSLEGSVGRNLGLTIFVMIGCWFTALTLFAASQEMAIGWIGDLLLAFFLFMEHRLVKRLSE